MLNSGLEVGGHMAEQPYYNPYTSCATYYSGPVVLGAALHEAIGFDR